MNAEPKKSKRFNYKRVIIILVSVVALIFLIQPIFMTRCGGEGHDRARTLSNTKQIGLALFEFEGDYGSYPDAETAKDVTDAFPDHGYNLSGNSSNALFLQLFSSGIVRSEEIFYSKIKDSQKPDGVITPGEALQKGEVGFSYIYGLTSKDDPLTPLILTPLIPGTTKFDPKPFNGKAIIYFINNNAHIYEIDEDGHVYIEGIDILSSKHPVWKGRAPDISYPE